MGQSCSCSHAASKDVLDPAKQARARWLADVSEPPKRSVSASRGQWAQRTASDDMSTDAVAAAKMLVQGHPPSRPTSVPTDPGSRNLFRWFTGR